MKKIIAILMTFTMLWGMNTLAETPISVVMEGETLVFDTDPVIVNDRTMVPMRTIFEELGATVKWDAERRSVEALFGDGTHIMLFIDKDVAYKNGSSTIIDAPPFIQDNRTMVPARFVAEASGAGVSWEPETRTVTIVPIWTKGNFIPFSDNMDVSAPSTADRKMKITDGRKDGDASVYTYDISAASIDSVIKYEQILTEQGFNNVYGTATDSKKAFWNGRKAVETTLDGNTYVVRVYKSSSKPE